MLKIQCFFYITMLKNHHLGSRYGLTFGDVPHPQKSGRTYQGISFSPMVFKIELILEKCLQPKKPRLADKGEG